MRCLYAGPVLCRPCFFVQWGQRWTESGPEDNREPLKKYFQFFESITASRIFRA